MNESTGECILMSRFLILHLYPVYLTRLFWMACKMGGERPCCCILWGAAITICSKQVVSSLCSSRQAFSSGVLLVIGSETMQQYRLGFLTSKLSYMDNCPVAGALEYTDCFSAEG